MAFLPDTNVWICLLKHPGGELAAKVQSQPVAAILFCSIVKAELLHGAEKYGNRDRRLHALDMLFAPFASLPFDDAAASHYAAVRHQLELEGRAMGPNDLQIAAIALTHGLTLVSADAGFGRVPGLQVADWTKT